MSNDADTELADVTVDPPGTRLRAARDAAGLGQNEVAAELRLSIDTIDALEHDAVDRLPAPIFVRGYLRNYAALVGLPAQELVDAYNRTVGRGQAQGLMAGPMQQQLVGARRRNYLVWLLVLIAAVGVGWWFQQRNALQRADVPGIEQRETPNAAPSPAQGATTQTNEVDTAAQPTDRATAEQNQSAAADSAVSDATEPQALPPQAEPVTPPPDDVAPQAVPKASEAPQESPAPQASASAPAPSQAAAPGPAADSLTLTFSGRSWVEVRDAAGERLLYRLADAGEARTVQGKAPFRLVLGNAPAVRVELNGKPVDVAAHTSGRTARFSVAR